MLQEEGKEVAVEVAVKDLQPIGTLRRLGRRGEGSQEHGRGHSAGPLLGIQFGAGFECQQGLVLRLLLEAVQSCHGIEQKRIVMKRILRAEG